MVGQTGWEQVLENNKQAFAADFVARSRFTTAYPTTLTPAQFVDALFTNAGVTPSATDRDAAINEFGGAANTADTAARGASVAAGGGKLNLGPTGIQTSVCVDAVLRLPAPQSKRRAGARIEFRRLQLLAGQAEPVQRQLRQRRNGESVHRLRRVPPTLRAVRVPQAHSVRVCRKGSRHLSDLVLACPGASRNLRLL